MRYGPEQERIAQEIAVMTRAEVVQGLLNFEGAVRMDFTPEFLAGQSLEQLRHILLAASTHISPRPVAAGR